MTNYTVTGNKPEVPVVELGSLGLSDTAFWTPDGSRWSIITAGADGSYFCHDTRRVDTLSPATQVVVADAVSVNFS